MIRHQFKKLVLAVIILSGVVFGTSDAGAQAAAAANPAAASQTGQYTAYYFHGNYRCQSCTRIEEWSHEAITSGFAEQLKNGTLQWRVVNMEESEYVHFVKDFNLFTKSLVIVENSGGKPVRWENLQKVWHYLQDQESFSKYVNSSLSAFMEKN